MTELNPLEHVDTSELIAEIQRRSRVAFIATRPLADDPDYTAIYCMSVDGKTHTDTGDDRDRCYGLAHTAMWESMRQVDRIASRKRP